jgi:2-polyprenyl-6-methoxyphenol hydroxylase-like FAD-dependent oxidoreductase
MSTPEQSLLIAGAGIGGLTLAHGLTTAGQRLRIFERDPGPQARDQGYRLHLHGEAVAALRRCLRPEAFDVFWQLSEPLGHASRSSITGCHSEQRVRPRRVVEM